MTDAEADRLNAKYGRFYLTRYSPRSCKFVQVGKPRTDIRQAIADAIELDRKNVRGWITFVEATRPN